MRRAYTSTVIGPVQLVAGVLCAGLLATTTVTVGAPVWVTVLGVGTILAVSVQLSTVRLSIGAGRVVIGAGPWSRRARVIPAAAVASATDEDLRWPQVFGVGIRFHRNTARLTVRPGPTLCLKLTTGERLRISTQHPAAARGLLLAGEENE